MAHVISRKPTDVITLSIRTNAVSSGALPLPGRESGIRQLKMWGGIASTARTGPMVRPG